MVREPALAGGTLTNFQTIRTRINYMIELQQKREQGYSVAAQEGRGQAGRNLGQAGKYFLGIKEMTAPPQAMFVIDIAKEDICIAEARRMGVKIFPSLTPTATRT